MTEITFAVAGWAAWSPERPDKGAWLAWAGRPQPAQEDPARAPVMLRRRITPIGQQALQAAWNLPASQHARIVFASRDGEFGRTLSVLETLDRPEIVSPSDFSLVVHHALAGLLSIARGNRAGHGAVAAGRDSLWYGLVEAVGCLTEPDEPSVLMVYHNEPLPPPYDQFEDSPGETIALALEIVANGENTLRLRQAPASPSGSEDLPPGESLLRTLLTGAPTTIRGERHLWQLERVGALD